MTYSYAVGFYRLQLPAISQSKAFLALVTEASAEQIQFTFLHVDGNVIKCGQVMTDPESFSDMVMETLTKHEASRAILNELTAGRSIGEVRLILGMLAAELGPAHNQFLDSIEDTMTPRYPPALITMETQSGTSIAIISLN